MVDAIMVSRINEAEKAYKRARDVDRSIRANVLQNNVFHFTNPRTGHDCRLCDPDDVRELDDDDYAMFLALLHDEYERTGYDAGQNIVAERYGVKLAAEEAVLEWARERLNRTDCDAFNRAAMNPKYRDMLIALIVAK